MRFSGKIWKIFSVLYETCQNKMHKYPCPFNTSFFELILLKRTLLILSSIKPLTRDKKGLAHFVHRTLMVNSKLFHFYYCLTTHDRLVFQGSANFIVIGLPIRLTRQAELRLKKLLFFLANFINAISSKVNFATVFIVAHSNSLFFPRKEGTRFQNFFSNKCII